MASKKGSVINVVVCGLTTASFQGLTGQGAGKSYLCNRFVRPKHDELREHTSVLNNSDFGSNIINQNHFLYWGGKTVGLEDGQEVTIQLVEHTEFVDDSTFKPFTHSKPYHKRCTQLKLHSGGKVMYISDDQLALPEEYSDVPKFPDKFSIDGFILCVDVSTPLDFSNPQREFVTRLFQAIQQTKKPIVVAMTKYDSAIDESVASVAELVSKSKKQIQLIEVSAIRNINVDACFLVLCHLVDPKKPKTKLTTFADAKTHLDERIRKVEDAFQSLLHREVTDFSQDMFQVCKELQKQSEYELLLELKGLDRIYKLVRGQLAFLKRQQLECKLMRYVELLPLILDALIPNLSLNDNIESCCTALRSSSKFSQYFEDVREWRDDNDLLKSTNRDTVPYGLMLEDIGREVLHNHIDKVLKTQREDAAFDKIQDVLRNARGLMPGTKQALLWEELGVAEEAELVSGDRLTKLFLEHMSEVLRDCVTDLKELILESIELFEEQLVGDVQQTINKIDTELKDCPRYKRLDLRADVRKGQVLKYIGSVQVGDSASQARTHISDGLEKMGREKLLRREVLRPPTVSVRPPGELQWNLYTDRDEYLNLSLLARTLDNVLTLRSDFMNHLPGSGLFDAGGQSYRLDMSLFHGDIVSMTNHDYIPDGAVAVVNSMECVDWLEDMLTRLWVPEVMTSLPPYRGMPLVILALDKEADDSEDSNTPLHRRAKALAARVQATCITERPTIQPKRLVVSTVIVQLLNAIMEVVLPTATFFSSPLPVKDHQGLNIAVCSVVDDPYPAMDLLSPWLRHQAVCFEQSKLFVHSNLDKMLRMCTLTFHSALDVKEIVSFTRLGVILAYSPSRPASLAVIKFLLSKLPAVPKMIIAMVSEEESWDNHMSEGRQVAEKCDAVFVSTSDPEWTIGYTAEFFSKCWFGRFTSWSSQTMPEEVVSRQREKRQARALPSRPVSERELPVILPTRIRHSVGALLDEESPPLTPTYPSGTMPRPPARERHNKKAASVPSPPLLDSGIYSDPISADIGIKQMKAATLERKKSSVTDPGSAHFRPLMSPDITDSPFPEGDYASVEDAVRFQGNTLAMFNTLERQRQTLRSPSMSPPPVPISPTDTEISILDGGSDEEEPNSMYATVQTTPRQRASKLAANRGYDHLEASPEVQRKKPPSYDRLNPPPIPSRTDSLPVIPRQPPPTPLTLPTPSQTTSLEDMYATVDLSAKTRRPPPTHSRHRSEDNTLNNNEALYSTVIKPPRTKPKPSPRRSTTPDEPVYSLPEKVVRGRRSPPIPAKTPPPIAPKPSKKSPTPPIGHNPRVSGRAESFNTGVRTKPPLLSSDKMGRSYSMDKRQGIKSPLTPSREHSFSLPRDYRHDGVQENGHALTRSLESSLEEGPPSIPARRYQPTDLDLDDEAPPLPPRVYNWSDFEDNDDELFQSEDELDDHSWTVSDQQKLYATITQATQRSDSMSGVEAVYHVVNKMVLMSDNIQVARESSLTQEEESAYDTLENVLKSMRTEGHTPYSPTRTEGGHRSMVPQPQQGKPATPPQARSPLSRENQAQGLQSTPLTAGEIKNLRKTQKLLKQLEKQAQKEAARRHAREAKKKKRDYDDKRRKDGKKKTRKGKKEPELNRYFGSPLESVVDEGGVPVFVRKCVEFVEREGLRSEGIYRVPGKKENVLLLQDKFEENHELDFTSLDIYESAVSSTLKSFFKLLPDPLIAESVAAQLLVVNSLDADSQKTRVHELLSSLPHPNISTLKFMMEHLNHIQEEHEVNKMTPSNLSIVFWPTLMRPPLMDLADPSKQLGWQLIMTRMIQCPDFVPNVN